MISVLKGKRPKNKKSLHDEDDLESDGEKEEEEEEDEVEDETMDQVCTAQSKVLGSKVNGQSHAAA